MHASSTRFITDSLVQPDRSSVRRASFIVPIERRCYKKRYGSAASSYFLRHPPPRGQCRRLSALTRTGSWCMEMEQAIARDFGHRDISSPPALLGMQLTLLYRAHHAAPCEIQASRCLSCRDHLIHYLHLFIGLLASHFPACVPCKRREEGTKPGFP